MDEMRFQELLKKFSESRTFEPVFTLKDYESMTSTQLSKVILEMLKFEHVGSYDLFPALFDLIDYLDRTVTIREDKSLEKYLHITASLVCLTRFQGFPFDEAIPEYFDKFGRHLQRIVGLPLWVSPMDDPSKIDQSKIAWNSMETEPSLQIATFLAYPLLEGVVRRKLSKFIDSDGTVLCEFTVTGRKEPYIKGKRISSLYHKLQLLGKETSSSSLKAMLADEHRVQPIFEAVHIYRNILLHGELTACWHSIALLLLTYVILLEG